MELISVKEQFESELTWRINEIRFFKNQLINIQKDDDKDKYRKSLILILYSHFEGFTKTALLIYTSYINSLRILRKEVNECLIASSMNDIFKKYEDKDMKSEYFRRLLPEDKIVHTFFRRTDLIIQFNDFMNDIIEIKDNVIDTESNLWYKIMQKNLYRLGIDYKIFDSHKNNIDDLVNIRNSIAHGSHKYGITEKKYNDLEETILLIMDQIIKELFKLLKDEKYKNI